MRRTILFASLLLVVVGWPAGDAIAAANLQVFPPSQGIAARGVSGDEINLYLTVYNQPHDRDEPAPDAANDVVVTIPIPPGSQLTNVNVPQPWTCNAASDAIVCRTAQLRSMPIGDYDELTFTIRLTDQAQGTLSYTGTAEAANSPRWTFEAGYFVYGRITVTNTNDSGAGSLRDAIVRMNESTPGAPWHVAFELPPSSVFEPLTPLPTITACSDVVVDVGGSSTGSIEAARPYALSGARVSSGSGLALRPNCADGFNASFHLTGLAIGGFPVNGIDIQPAPRPYEVNLGGLFIGTDMTGTLARPNGWRGVVISADSKVTIYRSILSANGRSGIFAWQAGAVSVIDSFIGVGSDRRPMGNGASGVFIRAGSLRMSGTVVAHNAHWGVSALPGAYMLAVHSNSFYSNGVLGIDWGVDFQTLHSTVTSPAAPVITSAIYDPVLNTTTVRGTLTVDRILTGDRNRIYVYSSGSSRTRYGFVEGERQEGVSEPHANRNVPGTSEWIVVIPGDLRGRLVTALTAVGLSEGWDYYSSEFSLPVAVQ